MSTTTPDPKFTAACARIAEGDSVTAACLAVNLPRRTFFRMLADDDGACLHQYVRAREVKAFARADEIDEIVRRTLLPRDNQEYLEPNAARVAIDAIKWQAGKENAKRYGEKFTIENESSSAKPLSRADSMAALREGSITMDDLLQRWTKPVQQLEAPPAVEAPADPGADVLDCDV